MNLFYKLANQKKLHSGSWSDWVVECRALTDHDMDCLAHIASTELLPDFGMVIGIPRGGARFAEALANYVKPKSNSLLIADDVCTTGYSFEDFQKGVINYGRQFEDGMPETIIGCAIFARGPLPAWCCALWHLGAPHPLRLK
jgi:orotate phosphoribosyltransferase